MPSLTLSDQLIWFAHCPKAGGTSVERYMVDRWGDAVGHLHWGWDIWWRNGGWRCAHPPNSPQHLIWSDALTVLPRVPDRTFALVRDPVARFASEYRWQRQGRRGTRLGKLLSFLPFSLWLRVMIKVAQLNPNAFDNHLRPQTDFVPDCAIVFRLEDGLEPVLRWLNNEVGEKQIDITPHEVSTTGHFSINETDRARIIAAFGVDFHRFGYGVMAAHIEPDLGDKLAKAIAPVIMRLDRIGLL